MAELFSKEHIVPGRRSSALYFHRWGWWVLAAAFRAGLFAFFILLTWIGVIGDTGVAATSYVCLYPEDYFLLVLSWFTGSEAQSMSGEMLAVVVFLDTLVAGYLLTIAFNIRRRRHNGTKATD